MTTVAAAGTPSVPSAPRCLRISAGNPAPGRTLLFNAFTKRPVCPSQAYFCCSILISAFGQLLSGEMVPSVSHAFTKASFRETACLPRLQQVPGGAHGTNRVRISGPRAGAGAFFPCAMGRHSDWLLLPEPRLHDVVTSSWFAACQSRVPHPNPSVGFSRQSCELAKCSSFPSGGGGN